MVLGPTTTALSLLVAPATFAAAARNPFLLEEREPQALARPLVQLGLLALGGYALCAFGPRVGEAFLSPVPYPPPELVPAREIFESARLWVPTTIGVFAVLSGVAGCLIGRVTEGWSRKRQVATTWFSCLTLFLSFWLPLLLIVNWILHRGVPTPWILPGSLLFPTFLIVAVAWRAFGDIHWAGILQRYRAKTDSYDPRDLDRVDSVLNPRGRGAGEIPIHTMETTRSEPEMIYMAKGLRRVLAPVTRMSPERLDEIVDSLLDAPASPVSRPSEPRHVRKDGGRFTWVGEFCTSWTCLGLGMLMVGMLGGVPPNLVLAAFAGLLGSALILATPAGFFPLVQGDLSKIVGPVVFASSWQELVSLAAQHPGSPAIVDPHLNRADASLVTAPAKLLIRPCFEPPIIEYPCSHVQKRSTKTELAVAAVRMKKGDFGDVRALELAVLQNIDLTRVLRLLTRVKEQTPAGTSRIVGLFFQRATEPCRIGELAAELGCVERTLQRKCRKLGIPSPSKLRALARVFIVTRLLHWSRQPLSSVALALGFSDDANCHRLLRQTLGGSPSRDMTLGEMHRVEEVILSALVASGRAGGTTTCP